MKNSYTLYILECADGTLYTGITTDMERRLHEHNHSPIGAKYTRARRPAILVYSAAFADRSLAMAEESRIKKLSRAEKLRVIRAAR
jgi:putative endonuclease